MNELRWEHDDSSRSAVGGAVVVGHMARELSGRNHSPGRARDDASSVAVRGQSTPTGGSGRLDALDRIKASGVSPPLPPAFSFPVAQTAARRVLCGELTLPPKLVAVVAPIGYGKTVLLGTFYRRCTNWGGACWWFSLDERDISADRLVAYLDTRLDAMGDADPLHDGMLTIYPDHESDDRRIDRIVGKIQRLQSPVFLFIDNINYCQDPALARLLEALVFNTPPWIKLILSSTEVLPIDIVRCKLEGLLSEYGTADLSFDADGVREVFGPELCARLSSASIETIVRYTEGWPSAVRLTQILLSSSTDPERTLANFSGTDQDIATILNTKVLSGFSPELRGFLLRLSLLRDFDVNLARSATGDTQAQNHLQYLCKRNVFLIPVGSEQRYRLHNVFRVFLRDEARRDLPAERRKAVLEQAALCCKREGRCADAVDYALLGENMALAAEILEQAAPMFVRDLGYHRRYLGWVEQLHAVGEYGGWETDYWYVWALAFRRRYEQARREVVRLGDRLSLAAKNNDGDAAKLAAISRRIDVIRIVIDTYMDELPEVKRYADHWLETAGKGRGAVVDTPFDVATVACAAGYHGANACQLTEGRRMVRLASVNVAQAGSAYGQGWVAAIDALVKLREGDYGAAYSSLTDAMLQARRNLGDNAGICGTLALLAAKAAVEMDLREEARELLARGLGQISTHGVLDTTAHGLDAAVKLWPGYESEDLSLAMLRKIAAAYPPRLSLMLSCFIVRRLIQLGRMDEARHEAVVLDIGTDFDDTLRERVEADYGAALGDLVQATQIELVIAAGKLKQAVATVTGELTRARATGKIGRQVELALDEAFLSQCTHNAVPAARYLMRAITLAARCRYLRPFRDREGLIASLVNDTRPKDWPFVTEEERRFFTEICAGLKVVGNPVLEQFQEFEGTRALSETPTTREFELLALIEAGLSNQDIADRLSLSVATVKWHLYNLYTKLGVKNRAAALARARSLNLLSR